MNLETYSTITNIFASIIDSIPENFKKNFSEMEKLEFLKFSERYDIPLDSVNTFNRLAALLILNRLRFIDQYEKREIYLGLSFSEFSILLRKKFPQIFIPSILEKIANLSNLAITSSLFNFDNDFKQNSVEITSLLYLDTIDQKYRRKTGQFWTPKYIAKLMLDLILEKNPRNILDPCIGPGTFITTLLDLKPHYFGRITGIEIHPLLHEISSVNLWKTPFKTELVNGDFLSIDVNTLESSIEDTMALTAPKSLDSYLKPRKFKGYDCIICNPPYSRHHVLSSEIKNKFGSEIEKTFGGKFNRISSLFMYFILSSLKYLIKEGQMIFVTPTISFESRNSTYLKRILQKQFTVPVIIVFHHSLSIFKGVDTAACIFMVNGVRPAPSSVTKLIIIKKLISRDLIIEIIRKNGASNNHNIEIYHREQLNLDPGSNWTSPRAFVDTKEHPKLVELTEVFKVMRGIATGNNNFFTFTDEELNFHKIKEEFVVPTVTKTRYVQKYLLSSKDFEELSKEDRKVWLLYLQQEKKDIKDQNLLKYLENGLEQRVHEGSLVRSRKRWFNTEVRPIPVFIFTYLSRGNPRFILNEGKVRPLNTFLIVYQREDINLTNELKTLYWVILNSKTTIRALRDVGRSYGGDTLKIEPKELMKALIVNPSEISEESKVKLLAYAKQLRETTTAENAELLIKIDKILERELRS